MTHVIFIEHHVVRIALFNYHSARSDNERLRKRNLRLEEDNGKLRTDKVHRETSIESLNAESRRLQTLVDGFSKIKKDYEEESVSLHARIKELEHAIFRSKKERDQAKLDSKRALQSVENSTKAAKILEVEKAQAEDDRDLAYKNMEAAIEAQRRAEKEAKAAMEERDALLPLREKNNTLLQEIRAAHDSQTQAEKDRCRLQEDVAHFRKELDESEGTIQELKIEMGQMKQEHASILATCDGLESQVGEANATAQDAESKLATATKDLQTLKDQIGILQSTISQKEEEIAAATSKHENDLVESEAKLREEMALHLTELESKLEAALRASTESEKMINQLELDLQSSKSKENETQNALDALSEELKNVTSESNQVIDEQKNKIKASRRSILLFPLSSRTLIYFSNQLVHSLQELESLLAEKELASELDADKISDLQKQVHISAKAIDDLKADLQSSKASASTPSSTQTEKELQHLKHDNAKLRELNSKLIKRQSELQQQAEM